MHGLGSAHPFPFFPPASGDGKPPVIHLQEPGCRREHGDVKLQMFSSKRVYPSTQKNLKACSPTNNKVFSTWFREAASNSLWKPLSVNHIPLSKCFQLGLGQLSLIHFGNHFL